MQVEYLCSAGRISEHAERLSIYVERVACRQRAVSVYRISIACNVHTVYCIRKICVMHKRAACVQRVAYIAYI